MTYTDFSMETDGFVGHMVEPESKNTGHVVIVIMGGERSIVSGVKVAERFADFGITGISIPLFGAKGLPKHIDRIPLEMFEPAVKYLKDVKKAKSISVYGFSMGSVYAALVAKYIDGIDNVILCAPSHVPFEGTDASNKCMTGHSIAVYKGMEIPYVSPDFFNSGFMGKYVYDNEAGRKVTNMWIMYRDAFKDKRREEAANFHLETSEARILLIAGAEDEVWPSEYSIKYIKSGLERAGYNHEYKILIYPNASHLIGIMPSKKRNRWLYRAIPIIGLLYRSFAKHREDCMNALEESEREIVHWILGKIN